MIWSMVYLNPAIQVIKGSVEFIYFKRKLFPKEFLNSPVDFLHVWTTGIRGRIRILLPHVYAFVFVICPKMTRREFPANGGCLRSGLPEAEPETRICVQVIYWGSALRRESEGGGGRMGSHQESGFNLLPGELLSINCTTEWIPAWGNDWEICIHQSLATSWARWAHEHRCHNLPS